MGRNISFDIKGLETSILDVVESQLQDSMKEVSQDIMKGYKTNDNLKSTLKEKSKKYLKE